MQTRKSVDDYVAGLKCWKDEIQRLREILQKTELTETVKWGGPCYTINGKNVVGMSAFKSYFGLWFHQGVLLTDKKHILINAQEGKTKALRQWRMTSDKDIKPRIINSYLKEAIQIAKKGEEIKPNRAKPVIVPSELKLALSKNAKSKARFNSLSRGLRREYVEYITEAKQEATKIRRIKKILPMIRAGKGLNDKYRSSR